MNERLEDIIQHRKQKLQKLTEAGINPYPSVSSRTHTNAEFLNQFTLLEESQTPVSIVGRIRSLRSMGKIIFVGLEDNSARVQVILKSDTIGTEAFKNFLNNFDIGDFLSATGAAFTTKTNQHSLVATELHMLAKSLRPLPGEHYGMADVETKLRKRYLDILTDPAVKELFVKKAKFWQSMRHFLENHNFMEMQMPILEATPGGAEAEPFMTHHNALNEDFYLRISLELPLKKMLVAGYEKVYEIGRIFRNEGMSATHLQDYTQMEFYWAYADFNQLMDFSRKLYQYVIEETFGTLQITNEAGVSCDWSGDWEKVSYVDLFFKETGLDLRNCTDEALRSYAQSQYLKLEDFAQRGRIIDAIFKKIRKNLPTTKPFFLIDQPLELEPLAKKKPDDEKLVQRMQIIAYGTELGKGFGELNDPIDQRQRFEAQAQLRERGDTEAQMFDEEFVEALEYGMPPAAGFGLSERLFAVLAGRPVRETVVFPPMKRAQPAAAAHSERAQSV